MRNDKDDLLHISPIKCYETPNIPTLINARNDSALLKKLPSRWKRNAAVVTSISLLGTMTLSACSSIPESDGQTDVIARPTVETMHNGGGPPAPFYVVYLTEQEALNIIRTQLESAGLNLSSNPPDYSVDISAQNLSLNLFDESKGVAVAFDSSGHLPHDGREFAKQAIEKFAQKTELSVGVFYNPNAWSLDHAEVDLIDQVLEFIYFLQDEGILTTPEISVTLDGAPIEFDAAPIVVNDRTMVPFRAIFEALGMEVDWDSDMRIATGEREGLRIALSIGDTSAIVNGEIVELDVPAMLHDERTMVPIRFIAESSGANVVWDDATRTVIITTDVS